LKTVPAGFAGCGFQRIFGFEFNQNTGKFHIHFPEDIKIECKIILRMNPIKKDLFDECSDGGKPDFTCSAKPILLLNHYVPSSPKNLNIFVFCKSDLRTMSAPDKTKLEYLWKSFLKGDNKSFSLIYQQHIDSLFLYGSKLCSDRELVRDCIQEIFVGLFLKRKKKSRKITNLRSYLFVSLRNCIGKKAKKTRKLDSIEEAEDENGELFQTDYSFPDQINDLEISGEIKEKLQRSISNLPSRQKEIIYLKFEEEMDYPEIALILKISVESARKLLYRALVTLRKTVDPALAQTLFFIFLKKNPDSLSIF
jgi:RNA polymerase sigma factor (sigma-70 family)